MSVLGIIPARYASTRFPGKLLIDLAGKTMIRRVYEQSVQAKMLAKVIVATDDVRIAEEVRLFGGEVIMTSGAHPSGTDRCAEVLGLIPGNWTAVINIQGDEPFVQPEQIDLLVSLFDDANVQIGTLVKKLTDPSDLESTSVMKVVLDIEGNGMYFSRLPIPFVRDTEKKDLLTRHLFYKHIGIYGYRADVLMEISKLETGKLEQAESLEQLRWLENGYKIRTTCTELETISVDVPSDVEKLRKAGLI